MSNDDLIIVSREQVENALSETYLLGFTRAIEDGEPDNERAEWVVRRVQMLADHGQARHRSRMRPATREEELYTVRELAQSIGLVAVDRDALRHELVHFFHGPGSLVEADDYAMADEMLARLAAGPEPAA